MDYMLTYGNDHGDLDEKGNPGNLDVPNPSLTNETPIQNQEQNLNGNVFK
jgi:hypothetical protein